MGKQARDSVATVACVAMTQDVGSYWIRVQKMSRRVERRVKMGDIVTIVDLLNKPSSNEKSIGSSFNNMVLLY